MKKHLFVVLAVLLVCLVAFPTVALAGGDKTEICHFNVDDDPDAPTWELLEVSSRAVPRHLAHGDGFPEGEVPGMEDVWFDQDCMPLIWADLSGIKWRDYNENGLRDEVIPGSGILEPVIPGWYVELWTYDRTTGLAGSFVDEAMTDGFGVYSFDMIYPGEDYIVCEELWSGTWVQTFPTLLTVPPAGLGLGVCPETGEPGLADIGYTLFAGPGDRYLNVDFGNTVIIDESEPNDTPDTAAYLGLLQPGVGSQVRGCIEPEGDVDYFLFELDEPGMLSAEAQGLYLTLFDSVGDLIAESTVLAEVPVSEGYYLLRVSSDWLDCYQLDLVVEAS